MGRASYQHIDNIVIGNRKAVCLSLVKKNHKKVTVCLVAAATTGATFSPQSALYSPAKPARPVLHLKK